MRRRTLATEITGLVVALTCAPAAAQIFKCRDGGGYILQQTPCPGLGQSGGRLLVLPDGQLAPVASVASVSGSASAASGVPKLGRVLGRTPLPSSDVARKPN